MSAFRPVGKAGDSQGAEQPVYMTTEDLFTVSQRDVQALVHAIFTRTPLPDSFTPPPGLPTGYMKLIRTLTTPSPTSSA